MPIKAIGGGRGGSSPAGVYETVALLEAEHPNGALGTYVVKADGQWYYWDGTGWASGGAYQEVISNSDLIHIIDTANNFTGGTVEAALAESAEKIIPLQAQTGIKAKVVACVLRNSGSGWGLIGGSHRPLHVASVTNDTKTVTITYDFTAKNVVSLICSPDEIMSKLGYSFGASVGVNTANITISRNVTIGGYVYYNGSAWVGSGDGTITATFDAGGKLTITHQSIVGVKVSVACRNGYYIIQPDSLGLTTTEVYFKDYAGTTITTADTNMKVYFTRSSSAAPLNPNEVISATGNIWVYGLFEVE